MARSKPAAPMRRETSSEYTSKLTRSPVEKTAVTSSKANGNSNSKAGPPTIPGEDSQPGLYSLLLAVGSIYFAFGTWAILQEKVLTTPYGPAGATELFQFPVFLLTIQSLFSSITGMLYLWGSTPKGKTVPPIIPNRRIVAPLLLVAVCQALAAPFGYAALAHVNYITYTLAKSCKLLPVMFLQITLFRRKYPLHKYLVVAAVTAGVAVFTLHSGKKKASTHSGQTAWGMLLLGINLLFDGLVNSTQDYVVSEFKPYIGPQMMCANNMMSTALTGAYLLLSPWLVHTGIGEWMGMDVSGSAGELKSALSFMARHPAVWRDVLGFAACGAVGQVAIFYTITNFGSVLLVTVTVTRKMLSMMGSVMIYGHHLSHMQWVGVAMVFGGIGVEAELKRQSEAKKTAAKQLVAKGEKAQ